MVAVFCSPFHFLRLSFCPSLHLPHSPAPHQEASRRQPSPVHTHTHTHTHTHRHTHTHTHTNTQLHRCCVIFFLMNSELSPHVLFMHFSCSAVQGGRCHRAN